MRLRAGRRRAVLHHTNRAIEGLVRIGGTLGLLGAIGVALNSAASPVSPPDATPLVLPIGCGEPSEEGVLLRISRTEVTVGEDYQVVARYSDPRKFGEGWGSEKVRMSALADALAKYRKNDKELKEAIGLPSDTSEAIIIAGETTPYSLLFAVADTCRESEFDRYHLLMPIRTNR